MLCKMSHEVTCSWFVSGSHGHWQIWASRVALRDSLQEGAAAADATKLMYHFKKIQLILLRNREKYFVQISPKLRIRCKILLFYEVGKTCCICEFKN